MVNKIEETYIGFIEHNDNEGEAFGYYFLNTEENQKLLREIGNTLECNGYLDSCEGYEMDTETPYTKKELALINKGARNSYMPRVNYSTDQNTLVVLAASSLKNEALPYKGRFEVDGEEYCLTI